MLKNILNLDGAQQLTNKEQKEINGGLTGNCYHAAINEDGVVVCEPGYSFRMMLGEAYCCK